MVATSCSNYKIATGPLLPPKLAPAEGGAVAIAAGAGANAASIPDPAAAAAVSAATTAAAAAVVAGRIPAALGSIGGRKGGAYRPLAGPGHVFQKPWHFKSMADSYDSLIF